MRYMFELSGEHPNLPAWEAESILSCYAKSKLIETDCNLAILSSEANHRKFEDRIALSHFLSEHLVSCEITDLNETFQKLEIEKNKTVAIRATASEERRGKLNLSDLTKELGEIITKKTRIKLDSPDLIIRIYIGKRAHIGIKLADIDRSQYEKRKNRFLPFRSPVSIHPRLARALINLTAMKPKPTLLDPFCGTGSVLIESAMMGFETYGSDISENMIEGATRNLNHFGLNAVKKKLDVGEISAFGKKFDCIVTDPPYGRSSTTKKEPISELYSRALASFSKSLDEKGRVGIILPNDEEPDYKDDFVLIRNASIRVHRSLTRNFFIFEKK